MHVRRHDRFPLVRIVPCLGMLFLLFLLFLLGLASLAHFASPTRLEASEPGDNPLEELGPEDLGQDSGQRPLAEGTRSGTLRFPAEHEPQAALMVAGDELARSFPRLFVELATVLRGKTKLVVLASDKDVANELQALLDARKIPSDGVHFLEVVHSSMWVRDYGPLVVQRGKKWGIIDADYFEQGRRGDDLAVTLLGRLAGARVYQTPLRLEGGNLLTNGRGVGLSTTVLLDRNVDRGFDRRQVERILADFFGIEKVLFLEPLAGEKTGHADMFTTFLSPDTVLVGKCDPAVDPVNAAILDRNAARLALVPVAPQSGTPKGQERPATLRVERIPMPSHRDGQWRSHTNVVYAHPLILVPTYPTATSAADQQALALYRKLMPGWTVVGIDASGLIQRGGALHCVVLNLPQAGKLLEVSFEKSGE